MFKEEFNAAVFPNRTIILKCDSFYVIFSYIKKYCDYLVRKRDMKSHFWSVWVFFPIDAADLVSIYKMKLVEDVFIR